MSGYIARNAKLLEGHRLTAYLIYCANTTEKNKMPIERFMPLITDKKEASKEITPEEQYELSQRAFELAKTLVHS